MEWIGGPEYLKKVPATETSLSAFDISRSVTRYICGHTHVYRKTQGKAHVKPDVYDLLVSEGLVKPKPLTGHRDPRFRYLPVFIWR